MPAATLIIGLALLLLALLGPRFGSRRANSNPAQREQRQATVLILRILAALIGMWLLFFSVAHLLHGHGRLAPSATHDQR